MIFPSVYHGIASSLRWSMVHLPGYRQLAFPEGRCPCNDPRWSGSLSCRGDHRPDIFRKGHPPARLERRLEPSEL